MKGYEITFMRVGWLFKLEKNNRSYSISKYTFYGILWVMSSFFKFFCPKEWQKTKFYLFLLKSIKCQNCLPLLINIGWKMGLLWGVLVCGYIRQNCKEFLYLVVSKKFQTKRCLLVKHMSCLVFRPIIIEIHPCIF